jgi:hypothetical protein
MFSVKIIEYFQDDQKSKKVITSSDIFLNYFGGGKNDWVNILEEVKYYISGVFQTYFPASNDMTDYIFYEKYYRVRNYIF